MDKDVAYILYKSWKNLRNGGKPTVMDTAEDAIMRNKTNYNETDISRFRDGEMGLDETITSMKAEISAANKDNFNAKVEAMKAIGGIYRNCVVLWHASVHTISAQPKP